MGVDLAQAGFTIGAAMIGGGATLVAARWVLKGTLDANLAAVRADRDLERRDRDQDRWEERVAQRVRFIEAALAELELNDQVRQQQKAGHAWLPMSTEHVRRVMHDLPLDRDVLEVVIAYELRVERYQAAATQSNERVSAGSGMLDGAVEQIRGELLEPLRQARVALENLLNPPPAPVAPEIPPDL